MAPKAKATAAAGSGLKGGVASGRVKKTRKTITEALMEKLRMLTPERRMAARILARIHTWRVAVRVRLGDKATRVNMAHLEGTCRTAISLLSKTGNKLDEDAWDALGAVADEVTGLLGKKHNVTHKLTQGRN